MKEAISAAKISEILYGACNSLEKNYIDEFRALDAAIGDGDLGITIRKGCMAIIETLKTFQTEDTGALIKKCGIQFNQANPSTFGVLTASAFIEGGKKVLGKESLTLDEIAGMFRAALEGIMKRGKAKTGEKTMLDALEPAVEALEKAASEDKSISEAFEKAAEAAEDGLERTKDMEAKKG
ncbi:dihydroxyacetone kinase subunit L, partial [Mesotoga sp.]|uniref:dihydroxyacetone kinase subunit L n=1 Tax=Mesotoga sp. TaxID=2053577 RepID=UPI003563738C